MRKRFYHPVMSSGIIRPTCAYGYTVDGVAPNTSNSGHNKRLAIDEGGSSGVSRDWMSIHPAAAAMQVVRLANVGTLNIAFFQTVEPVLCADGIIGYCGLELIHCGNADFSELGIKVGKVFQPGERIYREGTGGCGSEHVHIQAWRGKTGGAWHKCASGYALDGEVPLNKVAFVPDRHTIVPNGRSYLWEPVDERPIGELVVNVEALNVRCGAGTTEKKDASWFGAGSIAKGCRCAVYEMDGSWARIAYGRWVCADYCSVERYGVKNEAVKQQDEKEYTTFTITATGADRAALMALVEERKLPCKVVE